MPPKKSKDPQPTSVAASTDVNDPMSNVVNLVDKKVRNLEKRKVSHYFDVICGMGSLHDQWVHEVFIFQYYHITRSSIGINLLFLLIFSDCKFLIVLLLRQDWRL